MRLYQHVPGMLGQLDANGGRWQWSKCHFASTIHRISPQGDALRDSSQSGIQNQRNAPFRERDCCAPAVIPEIDVPLARLRMDGCLSRSSINAIVGLASEVYPHLTAAESGRVLDDTSYESTKEDAGLGRNRNQYMTTTRCYAKLPTVSRRACERHHASGSESPSRHPERGWLNRSRHTTR